jgi:crotonobetainyl-CoA:carnitine CoA-transferase CaiB-like acyl-CoA transferase
VLGLQNEREWKLFCEVVLQQPALAADPRFDSNGKRNQQREALGAIVLEVFAGLTTEQLVARLDQAQIANARMNDMAGLWAHPQRAARNRWTTIGTPAGEVPALLPPGRASSFDYRMDAVPAVGEHTQAILRELGRSDAQIAQLQESGAI